MTKSTNAKKTVETPVAKTPRKSRAKKTETITAAEADAILDAAAENPQIDLTTVVKDVKKRKPSTRERGEDMKVVRKGRNLSGNQPFQRKFYFYDLDFTKTPDYEKAFNHAPMQVRLILKYMKETGVTTSDDAMIGADIAGGAINTGYLQSKIEPAALFAYYRRVMERLGLRLGVADGVEDEGE